MNKLDGTVYDTDSVATYQIDLPVSISEVNCVVTLLDTTANEIIVARQLPRGMLIRRGVVGFYPAKQKDTWIRTLLVPSSRLSPNGKDVVPDWPSSECVSQGRTPD